MTLNNSSDNGSSEPVTLEAYSVVLSAAALALSILLGGGGSLTILLALFRSRSVRKYSYTLLFVFFFLCCGLDLLWSPLELAHMLIYHLALQDLADDFGVATFAAYIFLCGGVGFLVIGFCVENVFRLSGRLPASVRRLWPVSVCVAMFLASLLLTLAFLLVSLDDLQPEASTYLLLHPRSSVARLSILSVLVAFVVVAGVVMMVTGVAVMKKGGVKSSDSCSSADCQNEAHTSLPHFLLQQTQVTASSEDVDVDTASTSPPSLTKLPDVTGPDVTPAMAVKGGSSPRGGGPPDSGLRGSSMLGVNMAQVLGRRRHTICQIGDSGPSPDPTPKSKQYNYVRKFSVDISALQAQLANPKLFKDKAPFQSDQDLTLRQQGLSKGPENRGPLLPLGDLGTNAGKGIVIKGPQPPLTDLKPSRLEGAGSVKPSLLPPRPPVITVSEEVKEDAEKETEEEEDKGAGVEESHQELNSVSRAQYAPITNKEELTSIPKLPITQPVNEEEEEEEEEESKDGASPPQDKEDTSSESVTNHCKVSASDRDFVKMTLMMALTFVLSTLPLLLIETVKGRVHVHTYVNVATCLRALSSIQTIIYPHIVLCMDRVVNKAVRKLRRSVRRVCFRRHCGCLQHAPEQHPASTHL